METLLGRYKNLVILVGALFLQVLGLAVQVKRANDMQDTRLIRVWAVDAITPLERGVVWMENGAGNIWHNYFYLRGVRAENRQLKDQIEQMRLQQVRLNEDAAQARRLQALLNFKEQFISKTVAAQVIGTSGTDAFRVYIDKGENVGLKRGMAVITADGIVGKVTLVYPSVSEVLLINDQTSGVGAILEKTRLQGVLRGTSNGEVVLEHVMSDEQVPLGETILTSGGDQIFPKGMPVGVISKVDAGKDLFLNIKVKPAANLSKLEEVLVVLEKQDRQTSSSASASMRAADVLAQRLPSVPDKPADAGVSKTVPATAASLNVNSGATKPQPKPEVKTPAGTATAGAPGTAAATTGAATTGTSTKSVTTNGTTPVTSAPPPSGTAAPRANNATKAPGTVSPKPPQSANSATGNGVHAPSQAPATPEALKPVVQKSITEIPGANGSSNTAPVKPASKPANPQAKSAAPQAKPSTPKATTPAPADAGTNQSTGEDTPH